MSVKYVAVILVCVLLTACSGLGSKKTDGSIESQIKGNQGLLLSLQNQRDLDHLYFQYTGATTDRNAPVAAKGGLVQIGELNLLMQNVGGSATAGGLFVSGYDPRLITVTSRLGQNAIRDGVRDCYKDITISDTGHYGVTMICEVTDKSAAGVQVSQSGDRQNFILSGFGLPIDEWANKIASAVTQDDVEFFTKYGIFSEAHVDVGMRDGRFVYNINFGNPAFNPNRASHGYRLLSLFYGDTKDCANKCRPFPPNAPTDVLHGVEDLSYPVGEALYYDYDVFVNTSSWNPMLNEMKQTLQVTACYFYTTTVTPTVCVDPDPTSNRNEPCSTAPIVFKGTQGGPIRVSKIEQRSQPGATAFTIHIEHVGNGQVWHPGSFDQCSPHNPNRPDRKVMDVVYLVDARISGDLQQLSCVPDGNRLVRLTNGKGQITCLYPIAGYDGGSSRQAYQSAITLEFGYVYQNVVQKEVLIHRT
jgi:hypothetical protein